MNTIIIYMGADWEGLFVNGVLETQSHEITVQDLSNVCPIASIQCVEMPEPVRAWLDDYGQLPDKITFEDATQLVNEDA